MQNIGLKKGELEIMDYKDDYPTIFEQEKQELIRLYGDKIFQIEHVGSTSIKGIKSKPIIDIMIQTNDLDDFILFTETNIEGDIYTVKKEPTASGDYLIRKEEDGKVKAFIHVYKTGDINAENLLLFRDYLNSHEEERKRYDDLKADLIIKYKENRPKYTLGKNNFINEVLEKAKKKID